MLRSMHCRISGRVQGVFFRASTQREAERLGVTGWVRNLEDGSVEVVAVGSQAQLAAFREWLRKGPPQAEVERIDCAPCAVSRFSRFEVR